MDTTMTMDQRFDPYAHGLASGMQDLFSPFLGPAPRPEKQSPYAKKATAKWNMPENYIGESEYLRDTTEDLILTASQTWYTERILPWYKTDQIHIQWSEWENNPHYMGITPHQATSRVVTQRRTVRKASIVRRGIAAEFENDFVSTPLGRSSFMASLMQMARSVQETANVEVLRALLHCHRYQQIYTRKYGVVADYDLDEWLNRKAEQFMAVQKDPFGLENTNTRIEAEQELWGGRADTWILGREIMDYCQSGAVPEKSLYYLGGQEAVDNVNGRPRGGQAAGNTMGNVHSLQPENFIRGLPVYLAKSYAVDTIGKLELLTRTVEIGVYNMMVDRTHDYSRYRTVGRNLRVYDNDIDSWSTIELAYAIEHCGVWRGGDGPDGGILADIFTRNTNARTGALNAQVDDDFDFLSFHDPEQGRRREIEYIGDMSKSFINAGNLEQAGQTLLNALAYHQPEEMKRIMVEFEKLANKVRANKWSFDTFSGSTSTGTVAQGSGEEISLLQDVSLRLQNLVGPENIFFKGEADPARVVFENFILQGTAPAISTNATGIAGAAIGAEVAGDAQQLAEKDLIENILGAAFLQDEHKAQVAQISARTNEPWTARLQATKELALALNKHEPESLFESLSSPAAIDKWFQRRSSEFAARVQKGDFGGHSRIAAAARGASAAGVNVQYFPVGSKLPAGFKWAAPTSVGASVLSTMPAFAAYADSKATRSRGGGGLGASLAARRMRLGAHASAAPGSGVPFDRAEARRQEQSVRDAEEPPAGINVGSLTAKVDGATEKRFFNLGSLISDVFRGSSPRIIKWLAAIYAASEFTRERLVAFARNDIVVPIGLLLMRSNCTYKTRFGIKVAAGGKAGYTFFGHSNMQIEHEAARKVGMMHYTAYLSAVVLYPKNVYIVEDLYCQRYLGGMGVEFWSASAYKSGNAKRNSRSIICAPLPPNFKKIENKIDIRGRWYTEQSLGLVTQERFDKPLYPGATRINLLFGLHESIRRDKSSQRSRIPQNFVCWQGMEWYFNTITGKWDDYTVEAGHMGPNVYPGVGKVRNGEKKFVRDCQYQMVN